MEDAAIEVNFDGIVGPTHNYAGLSVGNLASQKFVNQPSNPRQAALQGLDKMRFLFSLGYKQAVLPPQDRPDVEALRAQGFSGTDAHVLETAAKDNPQLLAACGSASAMWAANAATVSPSSDCADGKVHFTPANMPTLFHRSLEAPATSTALKAIFHDASAFVHHPPLPMHLADEGAANHMRLTSAYGLRGLELLVYGRSGNGDGGPTRFPARQMCEASEAIAAIHTLGAADVQLVRQNPAAIDAGAFHNDVVAVGNLNVLLHHESAFADEPRTIDQIRHWFDSRQKKMFHAICASDKQVPLADAISTYLFNSQLVGPPDDMALIAPLEVQERASTRQFIKEIVRESGPIRRVFFVDVRQSMHNGGGPACLRLRVVLTPRELSLIAPGVMFDDALYGNLKDWITRRYREKLSPEDLGDPQLLIESRDALDELTRILGLTSLYRFQF